MYIGYKTLSDRLYCSGNEILVYRLEYPYIDISDEISEFYLSLANGCKVYCTETLLPLLWDSKKGRKYTYRMSCKITHLDDELMSVILRAVLRDGSKDICQYIGAHTWEIGSGLLISGQMLSKMRCTKEIKRVKKKELEDVFLHKGRLQSLKDVDIERILTADFIK